MYINNERYETITEYISIWNNQFECAYRPEYGLVKIDEMIFKISNYIGIIKTDKDIVFSEYIREKTYTDGTHGEELSEEEIFQLLKSE
jgi:hypothetical protein